MAVPNHSQLKTRAEFEQFLALPENADRRFELIHGRIVEKPMPTQEHGVITINLGTEIKLHLREHPIGRVGAEVRHATPGDDDNDLLPDISVVIGSDKPLVRLGAVPQMPDLAIEIKSPGDSYISLREKALYYLKNGAQLVWLVFPERQEIEVHTTETVRTLGVDDVLDGGNVLPGFKMAVRDVFTG